MNFENTEEKDKKGFKKKMDISIDGKTDAAELKEILGTVSSEIPDLIRNILSAIFDPTIAENYGKGIGTLYKQLQEEGLPEEMVEKIVMNFSKTFDVIGSAMKNIDIDNKNKNDDD